MKFGGYTSYTTLVIKNGLSRLEALYAYIVGMGLSIHRVVEFV